MSGTPKFFIVLVSLFCTNGFCYELEDAKYISVLEKPSFSLNSPDRQITLAGKTSSFRSSSEFTIYIANLKLILNNLSANIDSKEAIYNKNNGFIKFKNSVKLQVLNKQDKLAISSEEISFNLETDTISSTTDVLTNFNNLEIKSSGIELIQKTGDLYAEFSEGTFQINNLGSISKGYANRLYINSEENKITLEEEALLDQDGFIIKSDLIHYDYSTNKIIKSINSSIENNL